MQSRKQLRIAKLPRLADVLGTITSGLSRSLKNDHNALATAMGAHGNSTLKPEAISSSISTSSVIPSTRQTKLLLKTSLASMDTRDRRRIQAAVDSFRFMPCPDTAETLLLVLSSYRQADPAVGRIIDRVLEYRFLVGTIPATEEVRLLDNAVLDVQPLGVT